MNRAAVRIAICSAIMHALRIACIRAQYPYLLESDLQQTIYKGSNRYNELSSLYARSILSLHIGGDWASTTLFLARGG
jgi:hypothetical protein